MDRALFDQSVQMKAVVVTKNTILVVVELLVLLLRTLNL